MERTGCIHCYQFVVAVGQSHVSVNRSRAVCEQKCVTRRADDRALLHLLGNLTARFSFFQSAMKNP